jgi:hypothetical protein
VRAQLSSGTMAIRGDQWPMLVYADVEYDPEAPWEGLFRNKHLVWVSIHPSSFILLTLLLTGIQAYFYVSQLSRERGESNEIRQCSYSWHDSGHHSLLSLCGHTGAYGAEALATYHH